MSQKIAIVTAGGSGMGAAAIDPYGTAEEIAATLAFLASEGAGYITGQNLRVDGGVTRSI